uniref:Uncharacterized protein n=1 Tax=Cuerna arida TaxID=1464854 RepID=A0A1B6G6P0_9HEMI
MARYTKLLGLHQSVIMIVYFYSSCKCENVSPDLQPLLDRLDLDEKYHGLANEMYKEADKTLTQDRDPLKHIEGLNLSVRMLLGSIPGPDKLIGTEAEMMGKKILQFAKEEFGKHEIAESLLRSKYNMTEEDIMKFKNLYNDTKECVDKLNVLFDCV